MRQAKDALNAIRIEALLKQNKSISSISRILKISRTTIYKVIKIEHFKNRLRELRKQIIEEYKIAYIELCDYNHDSQKCRERILQFRNDDTISDETLNREQERLDEIDNEHERYRTAFEHKIQQLKRAKAEIECEIEQIKRKFACK